VDIVTIVQIVQGVSNIFSVVVVALGYYALVRVSRKSVEEMQAQRLAGGRPTVIVTDNYQNLPGIDIERIIGPREVPQQLWHASHKLYYSENYYSPSLPLVSWARLAVRLESHSAPTIRRTSTTGIASNAPKTPNSSPPASTAMKTTSGCWWTLRL
jgi:hypothetical protein